MRLERRKNGSRETEQLILRALNKDSLDWPKVSTKANIDILVGGKPYHIVLEKHKGRKPHWIVITII
jgi:hypothetical protein